MKKMLRFSIYILLLNFSAQYIKAEHTTQGLLIFLDDSEKETIRAITGGFIDAFNQETGPIIASASVINTVRTLKNNNLVTALNFDLQCSTKWVLKKINHYLYLLLPKNYLLAKGLTLNEVKLFSFTQKRVTETEQKLGLKVNHMQLVDPNQVESPQTSPEFAHYFIDELSTIFVKNSEYQQQNKLVAPLWSIYITGHGMINQSICRLSIHQFKNFLTFLEKIKTRLLIYASCYAAGTNEDLLYKDTQSGINRTYSFALVTTALTDASTQSISPSAIQSIQGTITINNGIDFKAFMQTIIAPDIIQYKKALKILVPTISLSAANPHTDIGRVPQIKYPGLEWFSILDDRDAAPIGSILTKTRTKPLHVATFFPHDKNRTAQPQGILLYAETIPFELVINTKLFNLPYIPKIVSMIPGNATHHIKKISSSLKTTDDIVNAFYIEDLNTHKVFIINEITASFSDQTSAVLSNGSQKKGTLTNVLIDSEMIDGHQIFLIGFTYNGTVYSAEGPLNRDNTIKRADNDLEQLYFSGLSGYKQKTVSKQETLRLAKMSADKAKKLFERELSGDEALAKIQALLLEMPNNAIIRIPKIKTPKSSELIHLATFRPVNMEKILWIESVGDFTNFIIDINPQRTTLFYFQEGIAFYVNLSLKNKYGVYNKDKDYVYFYRVLLEDFNSSGFLGFARISKIKYFEDSPTQLLLTPEAITSIEEVQKKKILDREKRHSQTRPTPPLPNFVQKSTHAKTPPPTQPLPQLPARHHKAILSTASHPKPLTQPSKTTLPPVPSRDDVQTQSLPKPSTQRITSMPPRPTQTPTKPGKNTPPPVPPRDDLPTPSKTPVTQLSNKTSAIQTRDKTTAIAELQAVADSLKNTIQDNVQVPATTLAACQHFKLLDTQDLASLENAINTFNTKTGVAKQRSKITLHELLLKAIENSRPQRRR